jgi:hypothetical protein
VFGSLTKESFNIICLYLLPAIGFIAGYIIGVYRRWRTQWRAQNSGEVMVRRVLEEYCKNNDAHVLNCITLRLEDGSTTQIDHVLVSAKGIFVIETKHYTK